MDQQIIQLPATVQQRLEIEQVIIVLEPGVFQ
jgi:hypothetical protein